MHDEPPPGCAGRRAMGRTDLPSVVLMRSPIRGWCCPPVVEAEKAASRASCEQCRRGLAHPRLQFAVEGEDREGASAADEFARDPYLHRRLVWQRGVKPVIARRESEHGSGLGCHRWVVERTFAWL